jgi:hypothetical protein
VGEQIKENELSETKYTYGREEKCTRTSAGKRDGRRPHALDIDEGIIIKYIFKEWKGWGMHGLG